MKGCFQDIIFNYLNFIITKIIRLNISLPTTNILVISIGYSSLGIALFKSLKLIQTLILAFFFLIPSWEFVLKYNEGFFSH